MTELPPGCDPESILLTFPVAKEQAGMRLDRFLANRIPRISRTRANAIVRNCAYRPDGTMRRPSDRVREGETVLIVRPPMNEPDTPQSYGVLYEDEDILVIDKPAGLPMHPTATYHRNTLTELLKQNYGAEHAPQFAHRLDRETSGVVVCGKHDAAEVALKIRFEKRKVSKRYLAITRGVPTPTRGRIELPLRGVEDGLHVMMEASPDGLSAATDYEVLEERAGAALVSLKPVSGRQHQLRVHLAEVGAPIVGDKLYGPEGPGPFLEIIDEGMSAGLLSRLGHPRQALHASELRIAHPRTGEEHTFVAPLPPDLVALWDDPRAALGGRPRLGWEVVTEGRVVVHDS